MQVKNGIKHLKSGKNVMFGIVTLQYNSSSEIFSLQSCGDEDEDDAIIGRVLTTEELVERFRNREDLFSINPNRKLHLSEIFALLFALLAGIGSNRGQCTTNNSLTGIVLYSISMSSLSKGFFNPDSEKSFSVAKRCKSVFDMNTMNAISQNAVIRPITFGYQVFEDNCLFYQMSVFLHSVPRGPPSIDAFDNVFSGLTMTDMLYDNNYDSGKNCCCSLKKTENCVNTRLVTTDVLQKIQFESQAKMIIVDSRKYTMANISPFTFRIDHLFHDDRYAGLMSGIESQAEYILV
jgi:hypothetical protein